MKEAQNESRDNDLGCRNSMDVCAEGTRNMFIVSLEGRASRCVVLVFDCFNYPFKELE